MAELNAPVAEVLISQVEQQEKENTEPKSVCFSRDPGSTSVGISSPLCEQSDTPEISSKSFNITLKIISPAASSGPFCRICHEGDATEDLVSICKCTGSVGLIHISCLERWLSSRRNATSVDRCEICNFTFETIRYPKSLTEWYQSDQGPMAARHSVLGDVACFALITPLAAASTFLCIQGAKRHVMWNNSLEAGCLMAVATFLVTVYLVWNILTVRYHLRSYYKWRSINQNVRLVRYRRTSTTNRSFVQTDLGNAAQNTESQPDVSTSNQPESFRQDHSLPRGNFTSSLISSHLRWILLG